MQVVARITTPVTASEAKSAVESAYRSELGHSANLTHELPLLMSLVWIETARGKSVQNNNLGNISAGDSYQGNAWRPPWFDEPGEGASQRNIDLHAAMLAGRAPKAFRAYDSIDEGAADFMRQLHNSFPEVLEAAADGDPTGFRDALAQKYSKDYKNTPPGNFESLAKEFGFQGVSVARPRGSGRLLAFLGIAGILTYAAKSLLGGSADKQAGKQT